MIDTLLLATNNANKVLEVRRILPSHLVRKLVTPKDYGQSLHTLEDGKNFQENAIKKAEDGCRALGLPCIADDSGLCVDALDGAPGIYSARFAGEEASDEDRTNLVLSEMEKFPKNRSARYICALALAVPGKDTICFEASFEGSIGFTKIGSNGFGYDPIFIPQGMDKTVAQLTDKEKDVLSHRGKALRLLLDYLTKQDQATLK